MTGRKPDPYTDPLPPVPQPKLINCMQCNHARRYHRDGHGACGKGPGHLGCPKKCDRYNFPPGQSHWDDA